MLILQAIVLGIVQGLTEFIPISSSAHLIVVPWLFGWTAPALTSLPFDVALHLGTLIAVLWFFAEDWVRLVRAGFASIVERRIGGDLDRRLAWLLVVGCIPGGVVGVLAESKIEKLFHEPNTPIKASAMIVMGILIAVLGVALFAAERIARHERGASAVSFKDAVVVGIAQALAIFPGVSRSGSTITAGLWLGLERETAARFSFLLSAPIIAGAGLKSLLEVYAGYASGAIAPGDLLLFPIGLVVAALSGYLCIKFLLRFLQKNSTDLFVYYRWALAALVIVVAFVRG
ncbi:MAG: undecaprenyl-diphosphatase UppP [Chloroflexi bacterium]|nr:undecaprenyl-diphosphatase UppP [Chloroflexota bacterium]